MLFHKYLHENRVPDYSFGVKIALLRQAKEIHWKKIAKNLSFWASFAVQNHPFLAIFCDFWPILAVFAICWLLSGLFRIDTRYV